MVKIVVLLENTAESSKFKYKHGLSLYVETETHKILFDMGPNALFLKNAEALGVDIADIDIAVISHGHVDHCGGLKCFLEKNQKAKIYIRPQAWEAHYVKVLGIPFYAGMDRASTVNIKGFYPGSFPEGFCGYYAEEQDEALYVGFRFSTIFGFFETGNFDVTIPVDGSICKVVLKTKTDESIIWTAESDNSAIPDAPADVPSVLTLPILDEIDQIVTIGTSGSSLSAAALLWDVRLRGSIWAFLGSWLLTMLSTLSIGMLAGGVSKNTRQASVIASVLYFPMLIFSGTTLPIEVMPTAMQKIVSFFPLTQGLTRKRPVADWCHGWSRRALHNPCHPLLPLGMTHPIQALPSILIKDNGLRKWTSGRLQAKIVPYVVVDSATVGYHG